MKTKFWSVAIALLALVLCGTAMLSYAQQSDNNDGGTSAWNGHRHAHMGYLAKELNLTDAQKQQIKTIMQSQRTAMRPVMQQLAQNRIAVLNATASGAFDQAKVQSLASQRAQLMSQLMVQRASVHSQIYNQVLTADQKAKADQLRQSQIARINQRLQKWSESAPEAPAQ